MRSEHSRFVISVHDVSPATAWETRRWVSDLDERGVSASLLVVPGPWRRRTLASDPEFAAWLRACVARGHEVCLHGWDHAAVPGAPITRALVGGLLARGCAEFWALNEGQAADRARRGLDALAEFGLEATGFTPPGWLISTPAIRGLRRVGLHYVTTHTSVTDMRTERNVRAIVLCHRPQGRGERAGATLMARVPGPMARIGSTFRLALHPDDLQVPSLREAALRGIDAALSAGAIAVTYRTLISTRHSTTGHCDPFGQRVPDPRALDHSLPPTSTPR